jgi:hypothetical protein
MVKDKHEDTHSPKPPKAPPALAEGHVEGKDSANPLPTRGGPFDHLLPHDSVPGTEYFLTLTKPNKLMNPSTVVAVGEPVTRVVHYDQPGHDQLLSKSGAPLKADPQPTPDFRFKAPSLAEIAKADEKYAANRRAHDHNNAHSHDHA